MFYSAIISKFLDKYIEKVDKSQINTSLVDGHIELNKISFQKNILGNFGIPLNIEKSLAQQVVVDLPIMKNKKNTAYFKATNVNIFATLDWSLLNKISINSISDLIQTIDEEKKATKEEKKKAWNNWVEKVIDNAKIEIQNVCLHIEFENYDKKLSGLTFYFESLMMNTINSNGEVIVLKQRPSILIKRIKLTYFSIALHNNIAPFKDFEELKNIKFNFLSQSCFTFTMTHDRREISSFLNSFYLEFEPIIFNLSQAQYFAFNYLFDDFSKHQKQSRFSSCMRPLCKKVDSSKYCVKMWSYLHRCALKIKRPHNFSPKTAILFLKNRRKYANDFMKATLRDKFVKKSIKKYGEDASYLLIQYSSILSRRKERIQIDENKDIITSDDLAFFSKDSFQFKADFKGIILEIESLMGVSINNINATYEKKRENYKFDFEIQNWLVDDLISQEKIIQLQSKSSNFFVFQIDSTKDKATLLTSKFQVSIHSSFLNRFCQYFTNNIQEKIPKIESDSLKVKSSSINQYLLTLNPRTLIRFQLAVGGFTIGYFIDDQEDEKLNHSFICEIKEIGLKNYSKNSTNNKLFIKSKMIIGQIKVDDSIISEEFAFKSSTSGIIDEYYFLNDLTTNLNIFKAKIDLDSAVFDKTSSIMASIMSNTQTDSTKVYSSHKIFANCSNITIFIKSEINTLILSISGINFNPSIEFKEISIYENDKLKNKIPQINILSLCFNKWPIIETDLINLNLNSFEFFNLLDEVNWILAQISKISNALFPQTSTTKEEKTEDETKITDKTSENEDIHVIAHLMNYQMGDRANSMQFNELYLDFGDDFFIKLNSLDLYDVEHKKFLFCDEKISLKMEYAENGNNYIINIPSLKMNFLWCEINNFLDYFQDSRNYMKQSASLSHSQKFNESEKDRDDDSTDYHSKILINIEKSVVDIEEAFTVLFDKLQINYENSNISLSMNTVDIDNLLEVHNFKLLVNNFIYDISIFSINANLSKEKAAKISNLSFFSQPLTATSPSSPEDKKEESKYQIDYNININDFTFIESSTNLSLRIPNIKFTLNSYHSVGAIYIPSINFESLAINEIKVIFLYNSVDFKLDDINSIFSLDRKEKFDEFDLKLTDIIVDANSVDFDYTHYFVMRVFNAYKIYSVYFHSDESESTNQSNYGISASVNKINIKEHSLPESISFSELSFKQNNDALIINCKSFNCLDLIKKRSNKNSDFLTIRKESKHSNININETDVYLNINTLKALNNIYESLWSLIKTDIDLKEKKNQELDESINVQNNSLFVEAKGIKLHFPFEDDPLFNKHDLVSSLDLQIEIKNDSYKSLKISNFQMFFTNYSQKMNFLPIVNINSFFVKILENINKEQKGSLFEIETEDININLSEVDIIELQLIVNNFINSFNLLLKAQMYSLQETDKGRKKDESLFKYDDLKLTIKPIMISLCDKNRDSTLFNPIFTLCIEIEESILKPQNQTFCINFIFSIMHMNSLYSKYEMFMEQTDFLITYKKNSESISEYFSLSIDKDTNFNLTQLAYRNLMNFIQILNDKESLLLFKNESKYNFKPEFWVQNNLDADITITDEFDQIQAFLSPHDHLPLCEYKKNSNIVFKYKSTKESFNPENIIFPTYYQSFSISTIPYDNWSKTIVFNSPLSIQNNLDCTIIIYTRPDKNKEFHKYTQLSPKNKYPILFEEKEYFIVSDFQSIDLMCDRHYRQKSKNKEKKSYVIDKNSMPETFTLSLKKSPKIIKIQHMKTKKSLSFKLLVNNDPLTNTRIYEIIPSTFIENNLSHPIFAKLYITDKIEATDQTLSLQSLERRQINYFNHDIQNILISLSLSANSFQSKTPIQLDKENAIFGFNDDVAVEVEKLVTNDQKIIKIFTPCALFNYTNETINFSSSSETENPNIRQILPGRLVFYGLKSYIGSDKAMEIDISIENSQVTRKAIDCLKLNSNCFTIYLPRKDNPQLYYAMNCSTTLGQIPMNSTHIVTFTNYLYVINNLPFDFSLVPVTSDKVNSIENNDDLANILCQIEEESKSLLKDSFYVQKNNENSTPIKWLPKNGNFIFSSGNYPNNPIIKLNNITRTVFVLKNRKETFYVELNIYEDKSTLYAHFQIPSFPLPLVLNNSLNVPVAVYQNIKINLNKQIIPSNSSTIFGFEQPFINNNQLFIEILNEDENHPKFLYSLEEHLSPIVSETNNIKISSTIIGQNNGQMIEIRYLNDLIHFDNIIQLYFYIKSLNFSIRNEKEEIANLCIKEVICESSQDKENTFITVTVKSIQIDDQSKISKNPIFLLGQDLINNKNFINLVSILPRGIPFFSVINLMSIQIQPIFIVTETSFLFNLKSFFNDLFKQENENKQNKTIIEARFNNVKVKKISIGYLEISPISIHVSISNENENNNYYYIAAAMKLLSLISKNTFLISSPQFFISEFNNNNDYLMEIIKDFYGNEIFKQLITNYVIKFIASSLIKFNEINFIPLSSINTKDEKEKLCDNRKPVFCYFNENELKSLLHQSNCYSIQIPNVIQSLLNNENISSIQIRLPRTINNIRERLVIGIDNENQKQNNGNCIDAKQLFQDKSIKRVRNPNISPIYSSNMNEELLNIFDQIENEIFKGKNCGNVKIILNSTNFIYCLTNEIIFVFQKNDNKMQLEVSFEIKEIFFLMVNSSSVTMKYSDKTKDKKEITLELLNEEDAKILVSFINSRHKVFSIFEHSLT